MRSRAARALSRRPSCRERLNEIRRGSEPFEEPSYGALPKGRSVLWVARPHTSVASLFAARSASWREHTRCATGDARARGAAFPHPPGKSEERRIRESDRVARMAYTPSQQVLERYADVLINFALGGGAGIKRGDVVRIVAHEAAKPLYVELHRAVWRAGAPRDRPLPARRRRRVQPLARLLRARDRRADRLLRGEVHARARSTRSTTRSACSATPTCTRSRASIRRGSCATDAR